MPTATILGGTYDYLTMPDGRNWTLRPLAWSGSGAWWGNGAADDGDGRYYTRLQAWTDVTFALSGSIWRVPSLAEWRALRDACGGTSVAGGALKATGPTDWDAPNVGATDTFGFHGKATGFATYFSDWTSKGEINLNWASDAEQSPTTDISYMFLRNNLDSFGISGSTEIDAYALSIRLVSDAPSGFTGVFPAQSGAWRNASEVHVAKDGVWRKANRIFVPVSGAWREVQ